MGRGGGGGGGVEALADARTFHPRDLGAQGRGPAMDGRGSRVICGCGGCARLWPRGRRRGLWARGGESRAEESGWREGNRAMAEPCVCGRLH
jgi:hypothetical protein